MAKGFAYHPLAYTAALTTQPVGWPSPWTWPGAPWPPGWGAPAQGGTTWAQTYNLASTSGTFLMNIITPDGNFTLNTTEVDAGAVKTSTLGGLVFTYSGASYGTRGTLTIAGTGSVGGSAVFKGGEYSLYRTHTGNITIAGTVTVIPPGITYTSSGESYSAQVLAAATVIKPLRPTGTTMGAATAINSPVYMRA